jgi:fructokinase
MSTDRISEDRNLAIVGLGELLWDMLPAGRQLGGAPANFSVMASRLGAHGIVASRVGTDEPGDAARAMLAKLPVDSRYLQTDTEHPTGTVTVTLTDGQPEYVIHRPVAWDFMELTPEWAELASRADAVCFGSLAQRHGVSRAAIHGFLAATRPECVRVFDVNLRKPHPASAVVRDSMRVATILKLNEVELPDVLALLGLSPVTVPAPGAAGFDDALIDGARAILAVYPVRLIVLTLGSMGSLLVTPDATARHGGVPCIVADAVGAGDAFTAALVTYYLRGASLARLGEAGNRWGAWVASQAGAMPELPAPVLADITAKIAAVPD